MEGPTRYFRKGKVSSVSYLKLYFYAGSLLLAFFKLGLTPCKAEEPLRGMVLQEKKKKKIKKAIKKGVYRSSH